MTTPTIKTHELDEPAGGSGEVSCRILPSQLSKTNFQVYFPTHILPIAEESPRQAHSRCSEIFYRKEIEVGIKSEFSKTEGDKNKIVELLKRIEDQSATLGDEPLHLDQESEEDSLAHRFSAVDVSSASADDLLRLLTKRERDRFFVALKDPSSGLARELLDSAELEKTRQLPWWDAPSDGTPSPLSLRIPYGVRPDPMAVPVDLIDQASRGFSLLYNICAVLLAYSFVTRHLAVSPLSSATSDPQDQYEARKILSQSIPFLFDRKSKLLHMSLTDAVISFWSRVDSGTVDNKTTVVLLEDVAKFVRPRRITVARDLSGEGEGERTTALAADHPFATTVLVLSDINSLFSNYVDSSTVACRRSHVMMKLTFYAAHILSTPAPRLHALADEAFLLSRNMSEESC